MIVDLLYSVVGLGLLVAGGELLVHGATALAYRAHVSHAVVGLTIVAAGTALVHPVPVHARRSPWTTGSCWASACSCFR